MTPETFGAWATAAGVLVALAFGVVAERRSAHDRKALAEREVEQREAARAAQAEHVSAWISTQVQPTGFLRASLEVQNASSQPVWDVVVAYPELEGPNLDDSWEERPAEWRLGVLPPGVTRTLEAPWTPPALDEPLGVSFRDNANNWWLRSEVGYLLPLTGDPHASDRE